MTDKSFPAGFTAVGSVAGAYILPMDDASGAAGSNKKATVAQLQTHLALSFNALLTWRDEGTDLASAGAVSKVDFVGAGVAATYDAATGKVTVTIAGGGGSTPTGTGLRKVVAGVEAGAAALLVDADIAAGAAIALSKLANVSATDKLLGRSTAGAGAIEEIVCTAAGRALIDDANAATQRTTLGLGTAAVLDVPASGNATTAQAVKGDDTRLALAGGTAPVCGKRGTTYKQAYYTAGVTSAAALTSGTPSVGVLRALPFMVAEACTLDRLALAIQTTVATAVGRIGIYDSDANIYPNNLLGETGELDLSTAGTTPGTAVALSLALLPGKVYWAAYLGGTAAATIRAVTMGGLYQTIGIVETLGTAISVGWFHTQVYGALPATFPNSAPGVLAAVPIPAIFLRLA